MTGICQHGDVFQKQRMMLQLIKCAAGTDRDRTVVLQNNILKFREVLQTDEDCLPQFPLLQTDHHVCPPCDQHGAGMGSQQFHRLSGRGSLEGLFYIIHSSHLLPVRSGPLPETRGPGAGVSWEFRKWRLP